MSTRGLHLLLIFFMLHGWIFAQITVFEGAEFPDHPQENDWFRSQVSQIMWHHTGGEWNQYWRKPCLRYETWHSVLFMEFPLRMHHGVFADGTPLPMNIPLDSKQYVDSLMIIKSDGNEFYLNTRGRVVAYFDPSQCNGGAIDTVAGIQSFCVPQAIANSSFQGYDCEYFRTWGMLGVNGQWLIPPKFDVPFGFQYGFAEVYFYGQKRKINEKGEFVE